MRARHELNLWSQHPISSGQGKVDGGACTAIHQLLAYSVCNVYLYSLRSIKFISY